MPNFPPLETIFYFYFYFFNFDLILAFQILLNTQNILFKYLNNYCVEEEESSKEKQKKAFTSNSNNLIIVILWRIKKWNYLGIDFGKLAMTIYVYIYG